MVSHCDFFLRFFFNTVLSFTISSYYLLMESDNVSGKTYQFSKNYTASGKEHDIRKGKALIYFFAVLALVVKSRGLDIPRE